MLGLGHETMVYALYVFLYAYDVMICKRFPNQWSFLRGIHVLQVDSFNKTSNAEQWFLFIVTCEQAAEQIAKLSVTFDAMMVMWRQCVHDITADTLFLKYVSWNNSNQWPETQESYRWLSARLQ